MDENTPQPPPLSPLYLRIVTIHNVQTSALYGGGWSLTDILMF